MKKCKKKNEKKFRQIPGGQLVNIKRVTCPHCHRTGAAYAFARFHFSNCKLNTKYIEHLLARIE